MYSGETLRKIRLLKDVKQAALAKKLGISQQAYSKLEKSKIIERHKVEALLPLLQCSMHEFEQFIKILPPPQK